MKIRNGFVSNSSSSSFVVVIPNGEKMTREYLKEHLFAGNNVEFYHWDSSVTFDVDMLIDTILSTMKEVTKDEIVEHFVENCHEYIEWPPLGANKEQWKRWREKCNRAGKQKADEFINGLSPNDTVYIGEFADDTNVGSHLEHSGIFEHRLKAIRFNHH